MTQQDKFYLEIQKKLNSTQPKSVLETIEAIRQLGKPYIIPLLIDLLNKHKEDEIGKEILKLLSQLRDKEVIPYIVDAVKSKKNDSIKAELIMSCWQSGLDYSHYIMVFAEEFISGDFKVAIEAFSVIEEWIHTTPKQSIIECKKHLIESIDRISEDKKTFYHELVKLVEGNM